VVGSSSRSGLDRLPVAKNGRPEPNTTGTTFMTNLVDQSELERLAADLTGGDVDVEVVP
jgi:hypothetical protein